MRSNAPNQTAIKPSAAPAGHGEDLADMVLDRRRFFAFNGMLGLTALLGGATPAVPPEHPKQHAGAEGELRHAAHESLGLTAVDALGSACFADAVLSLATKRPSVAERLCRVLHFPVCAQEPYQTGHHSDPFPLGNMHIGFLLNILRAGAFGAEVRHHTLHEFETTLKGVGLLWGLTSMAKGMRSAQSRAIGMTEATPKQVQAEPEKELGRSIFQLTVLASATQLPLTAFGNASIGNGEFYTVTAAMLEMYLQEGRRNGFTQDGLSKSAADCTNPQIKKRLNLIAADLTAGTLDDTPESVEQALRGAAGEHTKDVMTVLMSTACDDAQAALGDAGPLVGLYQSYGADFLKVVPAALPYTITIGLERANMAARRAGLAVGADVLSRENLNFGKEFITATWANLALYFWESAPRIASHMAGRHYSGGETYSTGREFSLVEQFMADVRAGASAIFDTLKPGVAYDKAVLKRSVQMVRESLEHADAELGRLAAERADAGQPVQPKEVREIRERHLGRRVTEKPELAALQETLERLTVRSPENKKAVREFAAKLHQLRNELGPQVLSTIVDLVPRGGAAPSLEAVAAVLKEKPGVNRLLDFNYWHDRIGPELADTMFVVFLQGLHLPFVINTVRRFVYEQDWFKAMPLPAREWLSVGLNNVMSMFADNWADCVAHSKWLTTMYFNELADSVARRADVQEGPYAEALKSIAADEFADDETKLISERFASFENQVAVRLAAVLERFPEKRSELEELLQSVLEHSQQFYWKSMNMAFLTAVTGGGKALTGNAPHFTFAAGQDLSLNDTLQDFKRHPLYHLWEFLFSTSYSTMIGPLLAQGMFGVVPDARERLEQGIAQLQTQFEHDFPGAAERFAALNAAA